MKQSTLAAGRHVLLETDQKVQDLDGEKLQKKLQEANDKTAKSTYDAAMKCFGDCIETGSLQIRLNY